MENIKQTSLPTTLPECVKEYQALLKVLQKKSRPVLQKLMNISDKLTQSVWENLHALPETFSKDVGSPAALSYRGDVYLGLKADEFTEDDWAFATSHLRILSGLFGVLKPLDLICPYRLEMGLTMKVGRAANVYQFWGKKIAQILKRELENHEVKVLLNLASGEYMKSVDVKALGYPVIHVDFREEKNGKLTSNSFTNKRMRGVMARHVVNFKVNHPEILKAFHEEGFRYREEFSKPDHLVFVR